MHGCNYSVKVLASIQLYAREVFPYIEYFVTTVLGDGGGEVKRIPYSYFYTEYAGADTRVYMCMGASRLLIPLTPLYACATTDFKQ